MLPLIVPAIVAGLLVALVLMILAVVFGLLGAIAMPALAISGFVSGAVASVADNYLGLTNQVQQYVSSMSV